MILKVIISYDSTDDTQSLSISIVNCQLSVSISTISSLFAIIDGYPMNGDGSVTSWWGMILKLNPHDDGLRYNDISEKEYARVNLLLSRYVALHAKYFILFRVGSIICMIDTDD